MKLQPLEVLSASEIADIHNATVDILSTCGVRMDDPQTIQILSEKGLDVDGDVVRFPKALLEDAIALAPSKIDVFNRDGDFAFTIGDGRAKIAAGHNAVFWVDSKTGETRPSRVEDVERFARICEQLTDIDMIGIPVMPQDVARPKHTLLYAIEATVRNSKKPIFFSTDNLDVNRGAIDLLDAAFDGDFASQVYGISQLSPTSPLFWERGVLQAIRDTLETNVPLAILPEPNAGVSAPFTLAGLVTVNNAECLSGLAMVQLLKPGAAVMYANSWTTTDMRSGVALVGSTESTICRIAGAQLAQFYHVPSHTTAPNSDNHAHDEQNSWEKSMSTFCSVAAGNDLIVNCGMFATGMTCSDEQLVMDEEISSISKRITDGMRVDSDTMATDVIKSIGPRGEYLTSEHTLHWLRSDEYITPRVSVRAPRASWERDGSRDTYELARFEANRLQEKDAVPFDESRSAALREVLNSYTGR